jgi:TraM recognition site of TraD and TraG
MGCSALFLVTGCCLLPRMEACARQIPLFAAVCDTWADGWRCVRFCQGAMTAAACAGAWIFQARCLQLCYPESFDAAEPPRPLRRAARPAASSQAGAGRHGLVLGGMAIDYDDLRTSILVTGVTGSSKTAGVLMPAVSQLFQTYREETADELSRNEFQKIGAFIPEVKGDLVDGCIYLAHEAGRCVSRDVLILSPSCRIPVVRYRDERGRCWFLSARGGAGGSDAGELLPRLSFPAGHPREGRLVPGDIFEAPDDWAAIESWLREVRIELGGRQPRFLGWRWRGGNLVRVSHTTGRDRAEPLLGADGAAVWAEPPRWLTIDGVVRIDNGIHYNLVDRRLPAAEAAERLTRLATMARGGGPRGENDYFYEQGRKVMAACISLHRAVETEACTAGDIVRLATQDQRLAAALARLAEKVRGLRETAAGLGAEDGEEILRRQVAPLEDLGLFFRDEWQKMVADGKTANVIKSTISGAFDAFLQDPNLAETFGQSSTFSFEDIAQSGKIIGLVPGDRYEQLGRLLGTACKVDFQSAMLARNGRADLNGTRLALYLADECHKYVISGSATAGDPYFMNLSRSNHVVNLCATQSYAWIMEVIGREAANVYISAFGVQLWLQQTDPETCRRAAEICGRVTREKVSAEHDFNLGGFLGALASGKSLVVRHQVREEKEERFSAEDFSHLDVGDVIAYNKGRRGRHAKVVRDRVSYIFCTQQPAGAAAVNARVREYYREILENLTHERGQAARWDCVPA